jgi:hypothetical protein
MVVIYMNERKDPEIRLAEPKTPINLGIEEVLGGMYSDACRPLQHGKTLGCTGNQILTKQSYSDEIVLFDVKGSKKEVMQQFFCKFV